MKKKIDKQIKAIGSKIELLDSELKFLSANCDSYHAMAENQSDRLRVIEKQIYQIKKLRPLLIQNGKLIYPK